MRGRSLPAVLLPLAILVAGSPAAAAEAQDEPLPALSRGAAAVLLAGRQVELPYTVTAVGPLFALAPLVRSLGGELEAGPRGLGYTLRLAEAEFLIAPRSRAMVVEREIVELTQPPALGAGGIEVPLDLLQRTYGDRLGYGFAWDAAARRLTVDRQRARVLAMAVDAVHLQRMTTVVLQFPERPRYQVARGERRVEVEFLGDRIELRGPAPRLDDPLVRDLEVTPERVRIELAAGAEAESYELERPFRLVFDIHRRAPAAGFEAPEVAPPTPRTGVRTIVVDPGHGGEETGATGAQGTVEKAVTLLLAQSLKRRLEQRLPVKVILTRDEDANLPLDTRTAIANQNKGDLFISLHLNSSLGARAHGAETYFLSMQASDPRAAAAAEAENRSPAAAADAGGGGDALYDLQLILWDLAQSRYLAESQRLANLIQDELNGALGLRDRGVKQAPFRVLMGAAMPAVLVEFGFLSNPEEEAKLGDPSHRAALVEAMVRAVTRYRAQVTAEEVAGGEVLR